MDAVYTVEVKRHSTGAADSMGVARSEWGEPEPLEVYAIAPRTSTEPVPGRGAVVVGLTLLAPAGTSVGAQDRFIVDGDEYEVEGKPGDWTRGPWRWAAGVSIDLTRTGG